MNHKTGDLFVRRLHAFKLMSVFQLLSELFQQRGRISYRQRHNPTNRKQIIEELLLEDEMIRAMEDKNPKIAKKWGELLDLLAREGEN